MNDPYAVLGVDESADDETIRRRYLELVRQFTPERSPAKFSAVREAYEYLKDLDSRVRLRLFEQGRLDSIEAIIEDLGCQTQRPRYRLKDLLESRKMH